MGRDEELSRLETLVVSTGRHDSSVGGVVIRGAAGVGKTRLTEELVARREAAGATVLRVVASAAIAEIPLGALAELVPPGRSAPLDHLDHLDELVDRVLEDLSARRQGDAMLLVIDDVTRLDAVSRAVVEATIDRSVAFVVATARTDSGHHLLPSPRRSTLVHLGLEGLHQDDVRLLVEAALGGPVADDTMLEIWRTAGGNPLLIRELVEAARFDRRLVRDDGLWHLTERLGATTRIRELVLARLQHLPTDVRDGLDLVAVAESLPQSLASRLIQQDVLDHLCATGLVEAVSTLAGAVVRPAHPIYGEVLRDDLGVLTVRALANRLADEAHRDLDGEPVGILRQVAWQLEGGGEVGQQVLVQAAREARGLSQFGLAERLLKAALRAGDDEDAALLLGEILNTDGRCDEAADVFGHLQETLDRQLDGPRPDPLAADRFGLVSIARSFNQAWGFGQGKAARTALRSADARLGRLPVADHAVVAARRGEIAAEAATLLAFVGDPVGAVAETDTLLGTLARTVLASARVTARISFARAAGLLAIGRPVDAVDAANNGLEAISTSAAGFGHTSFFLNLGMARAESLLQSGQVTSAEEQVQECYQVAAGVSSRTGRALAAWGLGRVALARGKPTTAARWFCECRLLERDLLTRGRQRWGFVGLAQALVAQGDVRAAEAVLAELDHLDEVSPTDDRFLFVEADRARAAIHAARGERSASVDVLIRAAASAADVGATTLQAAALHDLACGADERAALRGAAALLELDGQGALMAARSVHAAAILERSGRGLLAAAEAFSELGLTQVAAVVARAAEARCRVEGRSGAARSAHRLAQSMAAAGTEFDTVATDPLGQLSPRRREVLMLAAEGLSNGEIAERLGRSRRTIENHLHRGYQELGVTGRSALVDLVGRTDDRSSSP